MPNEVFTKDQSFPDEFSYLASHYPEVASVSDNPKMGEALQSVNDAAVGLLKAPGRAFNEGMTPSEITDSGIGLGFMVAGSSTPFRRPPNSLGMGGWQEYKFGTKIREEVLAGKEPPSVDSALFNHPEFTAGYDAKPMSYETFKQGFDQPDFPTYLGTEYHPIGPKYDVEQLFYLDYLKEKHPKYYDPVLKEWQKTTGYTPEQEVLSNYQTPKEEPKPSAVQQLAEVVKAPFKELYGDLADNATALHDSFKQLIRNREIDKHFNEIPWTDLKSDFHPPAETPRAVADPAYYGFNPNMPLFKGRTGAAEKQVFEGLPDPLKKESERGLFFSPSRDIANAYGPVIGPGQHAPEFLAAPKKTLEIDWRKSTGLRAYEPEAMTEIIDRAHAKGADMVVIRNMKDVGPNMDLGMYQDQYVVLNPTIVRNANAEFHPQFLTKNQLLAGLAASGLIAHQLATDKKDQ